MKINHLKLAKDIQAKKIELEGKGENPTQTMLAEYFDIHQVTVSSHLRLFMLPESVLDLMDLSKHNGNVLPFEAAQRLLKMPTGEQQENIQKLLSGEIKGKQALRIFAEASVVKGKRLPSRTSPSPVKDQDVNAVPKPSAAYTLTKCEGITELSNVARRMKGLLKSYDTLNHARLADKLRGALPTELNELVEELKQLMDSVAHVRVAVDSAYYLSVESRLRELELEKNAK